MQPIAESGGKLENPIVRRENQNIARRIQNCGANFAVLQMLLHQFLCHEGQRIVEEFGDVVPDVLAFNYH
jgi:hypothetical protein